MYYKNKKERIDYVPSILHVFLFFLGIATLCFTFATHLKKGIHKRDAVWEHYLQEERHASFHTKKVLPCHLLLTFDKDNIPLVDETNCELCYKRVMDFENRPMVCLKDYTNLQLKQTFGINHFHKLIAYEEAYHLFTEAILAYALCLRDEGFMKESTLLLEYMLSTEFEHPKYKQILDENYTSMNRLDQNTFK